MVWCLHQGNLFRITGTSADGVTQMPHHHHVRPQAKLHVHLPHSSSVSAHTKALHTAPLPSRR